MTSQNDDEANNLSPERRRFLKAAGASAGLAAAGIFLRANSTAAAQAAGSTTVTTASSAMGSAGGQSTAEIPQRPFGKTGIKVSAIGFGGYHMGTIRDEAEAIRLVHQALDSGITFMDNAWEYHDGRSEELMGKALADRRDKAFLMTKVCAHGRDGKFAMQQLEESLKRLKTDHLDLWQIHEVVYPNEPELYFKPGGAVEALEKAKKEGKVRFVGFTGHKDPSIHLDMLKRGFAFDACQLPLNVFDGTFRSFEQQVLPELQKQGIAAVGMKSLGGTADAVKKKVVTVDEALRYAMSLPVATTVSGIDSVQVLEQNLKIARGFTPMPSEQMAQVRQRVMAEAADGRFELFKSSMMFDGATGRAQHGFPPHKQMAL